MSIWLKKRGMHRTNPAHIRQAAGAACLMFLSKAKRGLKIIIHGKRRRNFMTAEFADGVEGTAG
jgi:hypothetical protein